MTVVDRSGRSACSDPDAQHLQAVQHCLGVVAVGEIAEVRGPTGQRRTDQGAVGDALRTGHGDDCVDRMKQRCDDVGGHYPSR